MEPVVLVRLFLRLENERLQVRCQEPLNLLRLRLRLHGLVQGEYVRYRCNCD